MNEIKQRNNRITNVSEGMIHGNSSELIPSVFANFADFQNQILSSNISISLKCKLN